MYPESNQNDSSNEERCDSSTDTIPADDRQVSNNFSEDEFQDTQDDFIFNTPTFEEALMDCRRAMAVFFNNDFQEAVRICEKWKDVSPIHSVVGCMFDAYFTLFTLEKDLIENLKIKLKDCETLLNTVRKQQSFSKYFFKANYSSEFTEEQLYYEFLQAMQLLMSFFLALFGDPSILSIIKAAFRLKQANTILRNCEEMIKQKGNNWKSDLIRNELERGYNYVNGGMNIVFSHLPSKVLSLLTLIGFCGDRKKGIQGLQKGFEDKTSLLWLYCGVAIMAYNLYAEHILGLGLCDNTWSWYCVRDIITRFPNSLVIFQFIARAYLTTGEPELARDYFLKVINNKTLKCNALMNLCNWDLIWSYALIGDWLKAADISLYLKDNCNWSPATNQYQASVFLYTHSLKTCDKKLMERSFELMKGVKRLKNRFAGRTIPWEKFVITKSEEFLEKGYLTAPAYELFYIWNIFSNVAGKDKWLNLIESDLDKQIAVKYKLLDQPDEPLDEYCLLLNLKACVLRNKFDYQGSIDLIRQIFNYQSRIVNYNYIMPNACTDLGVNYYLDDNLSEAKNYLHSARSDYTGYLAETMTLFKIHNTLLYIKSRELKVSDYDQQPFDTLENCDQSCDLPSDKAAVERIKRQIYSNKVIIENGNIPDSEEMHVERQQHVTKLSSIQEENLKNLNQSDHTKNQTLEFKSRSEASLMNFNEIEYDPNPMHRTIIEINNNYQSNPQLNQTSGHQSREDVHRKMDNEKVMKELVNELGSFKDRLIAKQRKNSILKRVKSLSKINFVKNLNNELIKDEIEFDLQKIQKQNKKKNFKRRITGMF